MDTWGLRVLVLLLLFLTGFYGEKILSEMKRCGDPECESLMIRAQASRDYNGPDCRYLNFKTGEEILVYYKLSGKRDDLWQGSQGKESGYFPKDAVKIEEVYISEEVEIPAKETDFICLDGGEYIFENEDSVLHNGNQEIDYLDPDSDSYLTIPEGKIGKPTSVSFEMEGRINTIPDTNVHEIESEKPQRLVATSKDGEQEPLDQRLVATTKDGEQEPLDQIDGSESINDDVVPQETIKSAWMVSGIAGWLGIGGKQEEKVVNTIVQPLQENSFHSRKIALSDEINPEQVDDEQKPEHVKSGWFDIGFREYLPFGRKESDHPLEEIDTDIQSQDNTMVVDSTKYIVPLETGPPTEEQEKQTRDSEVLKSNWFNLDLDNVINFGQILKENIYIKETEEKTDKTDSDEPKQSLNSLGEKCNADHEEKLKRGASGVDQKQNDEINTILKENPDLDQNTISKETNASREYQPQISDNKHPKSGWFNLGLDTILNVAENSEDITLTAEQTEERSDGSDSKEETQVLTPGEKDFGTDSEETYRKGEIDNDETDKQLKEFRHSENNPPTSGWFSNHFENLLNLKIASATEESPLPMEVNDKEQATELYNTKTSLESQLMERTEELLKQAESIKNEPGWYENMYGNFIGFNRHPSDSDNSQGSVVSGTTEARDEDQIPSSAIHSQSLGTADAKQVKGQIHGKVGIPRYFVSRNHQNNYWSAQRLTSKAEEHIKSEQGDSISEIKSQSESRKQEAQDNSGNYLDLQAGGHLPEREPHYLDLLKDTVIPSTLVIQTDKGNDGQAVEHIASVNDQEALPHALLVSPVSQTTYLDKQDTTILTHLNPNDPKETITKMQEVCHEKKVMENTPDSLSKDKKHTFSENVLEHLEGLVNQHVTFSKMASSGVLSDSEKGKSQQHASVASSNDEIAETEANDTEDIGNGNEILASDEFWDSVPQFDELFVKDHVNDFSQQPFVPNNRIRSEYGMNSPDINVETVSEDPLQCSALNNTFSGTSNTNEDALNKPELHSEDENQLSEGEINHAANTFIYTSSSNEDPLKLVQQNTENCKRKEEVYETIAIGSITDESKSENTLQTQEYSNRGALFFVQDDNILNEHHIPYKPEHDDIAVMQPFESFTEKQIQIAQTSDETLLKSNTNDEEGVRDISPVDSDLSGKELEEQATTINIPGTSSLEGELILQKQSGLQQISGIHDQDDFQKENSLHDLSSEDGLLQSEDETNVSTRSNIKDNVIKEECQIETSHMKDTCLPYDLYKPHASQSSHLEYVKRILTKGKYFISPSLSLNGEATQSLSDSDVTTSLEISEKENVDKCYHGCLGTPEYSLSHILDRSEDTRISDQYAANTQSEKQDFKANILILKESSQMVESSQSEIFLPDQDISSLNKHNVFYNGTYVEDSSQMPVEPRGQPYRQHKQSVSQENTRTEYSERIHEVLDIEPIPPKDLHKQEMHTSQKNDILSSPSTYIYDHNFKIDQNLADLHTPELVMINDKQEDALTAKNQYQLGNSDTSGQIGASEGDSESQGRPDHYSTKYQTSVSPKGITESIFVQTSGFFDNLITKNCETDYRSSETELPDHEAHGNSEDCVDIKGEPIDLHDQSELFDNDIVFATTDNLANSNAFGSIEDNSEVGQFSTLENKVSIETTGYDAIPFKASQERIQHNVILNEVDQAIRSMYSELQQPHSKISKEKEEHLESVCEENNILLLKEHLEKVQEEINAFLCEDCFKESTQETVSDTKEHPLEMTRETWMKHEIKRTQELQNMLSDIRLTCAAQVILLSADSGDVTEKDGHEKKSFEKEYSEQQNQQSEKLNINMYEEEAENTYDSTQQVFTDAVNAGQLHKQDKNTHTGVGNTQLDAQQTEAQSVSSVNVQEGEYVSFANSEGNGKEFLSEISFQFPNQIPSDKTKLALEILAYLNAQDIRSNVNSLWSTLTDVINKAVDSLPEDLRPGPDLYGVSWEMVICGALIGLFTFFLFLCRASKVIRSRHYIGREKQLACKVEELVENKCKELEKLSTYKKQYEELELSLKDASLLKESSETTCLEATCEKLNQSNSALSDEIGKIEKELEEEKSRRLQQDDFFDDIQRRVESLEKEAKALKSQADEARTTLKVFQINEGRLKTALQDAKEEQIRFQERNEQLLQEADGWEERLSELAEQKNMFEFSKRDMEEALNNKESQVKSLTECLLTMKDWTMELGEENNLEVNSWEEDVTDETENGEHLDDPQKRTVKKLIYAAKLNASLKTLEAERNQIYIKLSDEVKAKEELSDRIDQLQKEQNSLHSENSHFETDVHKLQQKLKVMTEMYQENELKLHRKLTVEERDRLQKEEKLSKVDEKIYHAAEELHSYKTRAKDLEEELEKTIRSYQSQITCHEKKGHDNWLSARAAERHLNDVKKENAHSRQKLTELEFKLELIEKDPYALDVPRVFGRENSPYGPSPLGRPSPETRAFNSPPTLMEGPLRLSPMFPGGERGSRGPEDHAEYSSPNERADSDRASDHQGAHSDTGSLSPPWERDRRINIHASGQYCHDPAVHPRRQERYYHNPPISGRFSGPAELLRSYNMHSFEKTDGNVLAENSLVNESSGNGSNDNLSNVLNVADHSLPPNNEAVVGSSFAPPPPQMRGPLMPMDPRGPFMRRVSPFPPPVIDVYGPRDYLPVRDFSGLLRHPMGMRNPFPTRPFLPFPHQKAGFYPSPPSPQSRNDPTPAQTHPSGVTDAEHQEPHQDT